MKKAVVFWLLFVNFSLFINQNEVNCPDVFSDYFSAENKQNMFHFQDGDGYEVGMKNYLYNIKFPRFNYCEFKSAEEALIDLKKLADFLHKNGSISVDLIIFNSWLIPESSRILDCQKDLLDKNLQKLGIRENRYNITINRTGYRIIEHDDPILKECKCAYDANPFFEMNSWVDVVISDIQ